MTKGYASGSVDFDELFDPDIVGDGPTAVGYMSGGAPLKYAALIYGTKRADVGYAENGVDVSNKWAAKGTAVYVNIAQLPTVMFFDGYGTAGSPMQGGCSVNFFRDGVMTWSDGAQSSDTWANGSSTVGDAYDIRFTVTATNSKGTTTGTTGSWMQVSQARSFTLTHTYNAGGGSSSAERTLLIEIRRRSDGQVLASKSVDMTVRLTIEN